MSEEIKREEVETLKITKNTKGYNFEYKLIGKVEEQISRIKEINKELEKLNKSEVN